MPLGTGSGGGGWATWDQLEQHFSGGRPKPVSSGGDWLGYIGGKTYATPVLSPQQQAALNWLQGSMGTAELNYNQALRSLSAQRAAASGLYGAIAKAARRDYGLTIQGIDQDLYYGNLLRDQEKYRNVTLGRERALADYQNAFWNWGITNTDILQRWVLADRGFELDNRNVGFQYDVGMRDVASDAIARGARTAAGTIDRFGDVRERRDIGLAQNRLALDTTRQALKTEGARAKQAYEHQRRIYGIDLKMFDSLAKTYGIQAAQAAAQAALAKQRAAAARDAAVSNAAAQRNAALASISSQRTSLTNNYFNQLLSGYSQLFRL